MRQPVVDVIIPVYRPDDKFYRLLEQLKKQTVPIHRIIVMNTEQKFWDEFWADKKAISMPELEVHHISKAEFDHGGTRDLGASYSSADFMVFMTDDAVPQDECLIGNLVKGFERCGAGGERVASVYARQLPAPDCRTVERYTRAFNYPETSRVKTKADLKTLGIKTYFCSNVCCAYDREIFQKQGGFIRNTIFNEDMIYAAGVIQTGYAIVYEADAKVVHSHNLSPIEQFHRNFDLAVSQADHPEIFAGLPSEGEGIRLVKKTAGWLWNTGRPWLIPSLVLHSGMKYLGYRLGKVYQKLPSRMVRWCTMSPSYWDKKEREKNGQKGGDCL